MAKRSRWKKTAVCGLAALGLAAHLGAQAQHPAPQPIPRTPDGRPDFHGIWSNSTQTPLERPAALGTKQFYTDEELARLRPANHDAPPRPGDPGTYNAFWWEQGGFLRQTSLIVDPPDGRVPALTPEGEKRRAARRARAGRIDSWEDRNLAERCITRGAPKLPGGYNNNLQIVQTPAYIAMLQEMIHDTRIIPLDGRPHAPAHVRSYLGDSRGRWEGDTLVVETKNFHPIVGETSYNCCGGAAEHLTVVERFTMRDRDTIEHRYTVNDPTTFTRPWTVSIPMRRDPGPIYEYACHEGNISMEGILRGARAQEREGR